MRRIAVSGHRGLPAATALLIADAIGNCLRCADGAVTGLSCLADGADQIFAHAVLDAGGAIEAVIPTAHYGKRCLRKRIRSTTRCWRRP